MEIKVKFSLLQNGVVLLNSVMVFVQLFPSPRRYFFSCNKLLPFEFADFKRVFKVIYEGHANTTKIQERL